MQIVIIVLLNLVVYFRTLFYLYASDDQTVFKNTFIKKVPIPVWYKRLWKEFKGEAYWIAWENHLMSLLLHTTNCVLVYWVFCGFGSKDIAFLTALLFLVSASNLQGAVQLSSKLYSFSTALALIMFRLPVLTPALWFISKLFMPNAIFAPLAFIGTPWWFMSFTVLLVAFYFKKIISPKTTGYHAKQITKEKQAIAFRKLIPFIKTYGYYFRFCLFPWRIGLYHNLLSTGMGLNKNYDRITYSFDKDFWIGFVILCGVGYMVFFQWGAVAWGLFWFSVNIAMWCNFYSLQINIGERYAYLANVGMMYALANVLYNLPIPYNYYLQGGVLLGYFIRLWYTMDFYKNEFWLRQHCIVEQKDSWRMWVAFGNTAFIEKNYNLALQYYAEAWNHNPIDFKINFNLAMMYMLEGSLTESLQHLKIAEEHYYENQYLEEAKEFMRRAKENIEIIQKTKQIQMSRMFVV